MSNLITRMKETRVFFRTPFGNLEVNRHPGTKVFFDVLRDSKDRVWIWNGPWVATWHPRKRRIR